MTRKRLGTTSWDAPKHSDDGCALATRWQLGSPSKCVECPFKECVLALTHSQLGKLMVQVNEKERAT